MRGYQEYTGPWYSDNTLGSESSIPGLNPGGPAKRKIKIEPNFINRIKEGSKNEDRRKEKS